MKSIPVLIGFLITTLTLTAQDFRYGKVSKEELAEKVHPKDSTADAAILYKESKTTFQFTQDAGFTLQTEVFERIKIYTKDGANWANKEIVLHKTKGSEDELKYEKGVTYNLQNGKVTSEKLRKKHIFQEEWTPFTDVVKFTMPEIKEGSVVEFSYTLNSPFIMNIDEYKLQYSIPANKTLVTFSAPEYFTFKTHQKGWLPLNISETKRPRTINYRYNSAVDSGVGRDVSTSSTERIDLLEKVTTVDMEDVPALKKEPYAGSIQNYMSGVKFELQYTQFPSSPVRNYTLNWDGVAKKVYESSGFGGELKKNNYFRKDLEDLLQGATKPEEKLVLIYEYVKNRMNWNKQIGIYCSDGVAKAYKKQVGNVAEINLMLTAMLQAAGLDASPVVSSTKSNGIPFFPTLNGFNYVLAAATINGNLILLDASDKMLSPNLLREQTINWQGRMIHGPEESQWVSLYSAEISRQSCMANFAISESLGVEGTVKKQYTGHNAFHYRKAFTNVHEDDIIKALEKDKNIAIDNLKITNLQNSYEAVDEAYEVEVYDHLETIGDKIYFTPTLFMASTEKVNPFKKEERKFPVVYDFPREKRYLINITIPEDYQVEFIPENTHLKMPGNLAEFKYLISQRGNQIQISLQQNINKALISYESYPDLKMVYELMVDKLNEKIVLTKA